MLTQQAGIVTLIDFQAPWTHDTLSLNISWSHGDLAVVRSSTAAGSLRLQQTEYRPLSF